MGNGNTENILDRLAAHARERVKAAKEICGTEEMIKRAYAVKSPEFAFEKALAKPGMSFICECKKASPSKGLIAPDFPYLEIAREYEAAGADCISVLTEPKWFLGSNEYLEQIAKTVKIPCIRKDFTVDPYMIYEARALGASAVLLICAILTDDELKEYIALADELGLSALVEAHDETEIKRAVKAGARLFGVNNRNLKDFTVDTGNAARLRAFAPKDALFVSESGIKTVEDVRLAYESGADAVLVGETLMRAENKREKLNELRKGPAPLVKICGLKRPEDATAVNAATPEFVGFVFVKGRKRYVEPEVAAKIKKSLNPGIRTVGVFLDEDRDEVVRLLNSGVIDIAQLHGSEPEEYVGYVKEKSGKPVIQVLNLKNVSDPAKAVKELEASAADYIMIDAGAGEGKTFDTALVQGLKRPFFIAGGLDEFNVSKVISDLHPFAVDVSSGVETDGVKDAEKIRRFAEAVRRTE